MANFLMLVVAVVTAMGGFTYGFDSGMPSRT
jgi:preprotein translocase subunit SecE